jgi:hypothetical protein
LRASARHHHGFELVYVAAGDWDEYRRADNPNDLLFDQEYVRFDQHGNGDSESDNRRGLNYGEKFSSNGGFRIESQLGLAAGILDDAGVRFSDRRDDEND